MNLGYLRTIATFIPVLLATLVSLADTSQLTRSSGGGWGNESVSLTVSNQADVTDTAITAIELGGELKLVAEASGLDSGESVYLEIDEDGDEIASDSTNLLIRENHGPTAYGTYTFQAFARFSADGRDDLYEESDEHEVHVVAIADLSSSVPEDEYEEYIVPSNGGWAIPFEGSGSDTGVLRAVYIGSPDGTYTRNAAYFAVVDEQTGDVDLTFVAPGPYLVKTVREDGETISETIFELLYDAPPAKVGKKTTGVKATIDAPAADLILISSANDNGFLVNARDAVAGEVAFNSVADAIAKINAKYAANSNQPFTLAIVEHGNVGLQGMGCGDANLAAGNYLKLTTVADLNAFTAACNGKVTSVKLYGCNVAKGADGGAFLQKLATDGNMNATGYTGSVYCYPGTLYGYWWKASDNGAAVTKTP